MMNCGLRATLFCAVLLFGCTQTNYRYDAADQACRSMRCGEVAYPVKSEQSCQLFVEQEQFNISELAAGRADAGVPDGWSEEALCRSVKDLHVRVYEPEDRVLVRRGFRPAELTDRSGVVQKGFRFPGDSADPLWVTYGVTRWKGMCWITPDGSCELAARHEIIIRGEDWPFVLCHEQFWHFAGRMAFEPPPGSPIEAACARAKARAAAHEH